MSVEEVRIASLSRRIKDAYSSGNEKYASDLTSELVLLESQLNSLQIT
jgi:hypothetical protein